MRSGEKTLTLVVEETGQSIGSGAESASLLIATALRVRKRSTWHWVGSATVTAPFATPIERDILSNFSQHATFNCHPASTRRGGFHHNMATFRFCLNEMLRLLKSGLHNRSEKPGRSSLACENPMMSGNTTRISRRSFLGSTAAAALAPSIVPASLFGANRPSERVSLGFIGMGLHGIGRNLKGFLALDDAQVVAVCDVMKSRRDDARELVNRQYGNQDCASYADWREVISRDDIDAVVISTPDHWHVPMALAAIRAGKDVCCEKPTLTIQQGRILSDTVAKHGAVFQTSTEDRSLPVYHRMAELVRNGRIGRLKSIHVKLPGAQVKAEAPNYAAVPDGFDYDMWLGPAPAAPYATNRCGNQQWRNIFDYSGGNLTDWGMHQVDTAQWANDTEYSGPVEVSGEGDFPDKSSIYDTALQFKLHYKYANGVELLVESGGTSSRFEGTDGWVGNEAFSKPLVASSQKILDSVIGPEEIHLYTCVGGEHRNFLDCFRSRKAPYFPAEIGHRCATALHIGNIAMLLGKTLRWNPETEAFVDNDDANAMRSKPMRKPWTL
jgi:predicted dehydrogenase